MLKDTVRFFQTLWNLGIDRSRMKLYDVEESAQSDIMSDMIPDKPINKFGDRDKPDAYADFKV